jgi:methionyl-tRNA formyltransferase
MNRAVVFAYHDVGVRCLSVLLARSVDVRLVLTHEDSPQETIWFGSVAELARRHGIEVLTPQDPNVPEVVARIKAEVPDFLFSFYYRAMLGADILQLAKRGALNMHGSLLPKFRGRVPVNWAIIHGETETGATLHYMARKPDAGPIVDQERVPILPDDTAFDVFRKVTYAAEICLHRAVPGLVAGTAPKVEQDLRAGSYFGGRSARDGVIDWSLSAQRIHDLVRAVAPPYPGASTVLDGRELLILRTQRVGGPGRKFAAPTLFAEGTSLFAQAGNGELLKILEIAIDGAALPVTEAALRLAHSPLPLPIASAVRQV